MKQNDKDENKQSNALAGMARLVGVLSHRLNERLRVRFLVGAHTQVAGLISSWGAYKRQPVVSLFLYPPLPSSLSLSLSL